MRFSSLIWCALLGLAMVVASCNQNSYSAQLKQEKKVIDAYIKLHNIEIVYEAPDYMNWPENVYLEVGNYCYFNLTVPGDTATQAIVNSDNVNLRYRRYELTANSDTLSYWNTNEAASPVQFRYNVSSNEACTGWHYALRQMKYTGAEGKLICPSKLGFSNENNSVTPYGYDLKMQIKRF